MVRSQIVRRSCRRSSRMRKMPALFTRTSTPPPWLPRWPRPLADQALGVGDVERGERPVVAEGRRHRRALLRQDVGHHHPWRPPRANIRASDSPMAPRPAGDDRHLALESCPWRLIIAGAPGDAIMAGMCGVFGVFAPGQPVSHLTYLGLYALQHRGQESAGMAVADAGRPHGREGHGPRVQRLRRPHARRAVGHVCHRSRPLQHHRLVDVAQRPARLPRRRPPPVRPRPQRQPDQHRGPRRRSRACCPAPPPATATWWPSCWPSHMARRPDRTSSTPCRRAAHARGGVLAGPRRRRPGHRRPRPRRLPAAVPRAPRRRLGARLGDAGARHRGRRASCGSSSRARSWPSAPTAPAASAPFRRDRLDPHLCLFEFVYFARPDAQLYGSNVAAARTRMGELLAEQAPLAPTTTDPSARRW